MTICSYDKKQVGKRKKKGRMQRIWKDTDKPNDCLLSHAIWFVEIKSSSASCFSTEDSFYMTFSGLLSFSFFGWSRLAAYELVLDTHRQEEAKKEPEGSCQSGE